MRQIIFLGLLVCGCGSGSNGGVDQSAPRDMAGQPPGADLAMAQDLAIPADLTQSLDLTPLPDLTRLPDLTPQPDLTPPPDLSQVKGGCKHNTDCNNGEYCKFPMMGCDLTGVCTQKGACPQFCTQNCGCDGNQYCNECQANELSDVAINHVGACP